MKTLEQLVQERAQERIGALVLENIALAVQLEAVRAELATLKPAPKEP